MILALLFSLAARADVDLLNFVIKTNTAVQMNVKCGTPEGYETPSLNTSSKNLCAVIGEWAKGDPDKFDTKNPYGLCAPNWKTITPAWQKPEVLAAQKVYATSDFVAIPRKDWLREKSRTVLSKHDRDKLLGDANDIREATAKACCGPDSDCLQAVRAVRVSVCSSAADQDSSLPDACEANGGQYSLTSVEQAGMLVTMKQAFTGFYPPADVKAIVDSSQETLKNNLVAFPTYPAPGEIRLSPFGDASGAPISGIQTLRHEFGHACSFIKRQLAARVGQPNSEDAAMSFFQRYGSSCDLNEAREAHAYGPILRPAGAGEHVIPCLIDLAKQSTDEKSSAYFPGSCQLNKIEEATAEAFSLLTAAQIMPDAYPTRACGPLPSRVHPASTDVFTCLVKADPVYRSKLEAKLKCE